MGRKWIDLNKNPKSISCKPFALLSVAPYVLQGKIAGSCRGGAKVRGGDLVQAARASCMTTHAILRCISEAIDGDMPLVVRGHGHTRYHKADQWPPPVKPCLTTRSPGAHQGITSHPEFQPQQLLPATSPDHRTGCAPCWKPYPWVLLLCCSGFILNNSIWPRENDFFVLSSQWGYRGLLFLDMGYQAISSHILTTECSA